MVYEGSRSDIKQNAREQVIYACGQIGNKLEDGTFVGRIPPCKAVIAFGATLSGCEDELRSTLEDWIFIL
ncbi:MAG: hypothetical protein ACXQTR_01625 [Candidatus Methanospirareceae archaeon]